MAISLDEWYRRKWPKVIETAQRTEIDASKIEVKAEDGSFTCFKHLPLEIRNMIWKLALPHGRVVFLEQFYRTTQLYWNRIPSDLAINASNEEIKKADLDYTGSTTYIKENGSDAEEVEVGYMGCPDGLQFTSQTPAPAMLFVKQESYAIASKIFTRAFGTHHACPETWFDFSQDILLLDFELNGEIAFTPAEFLDEERAKLQNLAIVHTEAYPENMFADHWLTHLLPSFPYAKKIFVVNWSGLGQPSDFSDLKLIQSIDIKAGLRLYELDFSAILHEFDLMWLEAKIDFNCAQHIHDIQYHISRQ